MRKKKSALLYSIISLLLCLSMLVSTTFAWFTDSVSTGINTIASGVLDVELYHTNAAVQDEKVDSTTELFKDLNGKDILWEPGVVSYENLRITNAGDLALAYELTVATANENYVVESNGAMYGLSQILKVGFVEGGITATDRAGVVASVTDGWTTMSNFLQRGSLLPESAGEFEETWGVVIYWEPGDNDNFWNLNNGKQLNEGEVLSIDLGIKLVATQESEELDSIDNKYDSNAKAEFFPGFQGGVADAAVTVDDQGVTTAEVSVNGGDVSAVIPAGVQVADGATSLALSVSLMENSGANIQVGENEEMRALDVHIEGVAQGNTVPMLVTLDHYLSTGINTGALKLYHVENGVTVAMKQVDNPVNHNEFSYDPLTGDLTLALASFSEVATVADSNNTWDGTAEQFTQDDDGAYLIATAGQLAYFRDVVDGKTVVDGLNPTFAGETVKLNNNITLSNVNFDPIGWGYVNTSYNSGGAAGKVFMGTFDGNGNIIYGLRQSGWDLESTTGTDYTYTNCGFGLFASAADATFQNLTIYGASITVECVEAGILVGLSQGDCTYNNISIQHSKIANYQRPAGGLIGEVSSVDSTEAAPETTTITNVTIGADVVVGSLWGDFDTPCGGVIGARWDDANTTKVNMNNVKVHCEMDVYSDVTAAYKWYAYRRAGMLIGNTDLPAADGKNAKKAEAPFLTCSSVEVCYGDWANYHYCQFTNQSGTDKASWQNNYPWVRVEAGENNAAYSNPRYGHPVVDGVAVTGDTHTCTGEHLMELRFNQLYGGGQGVYGEPKHDDVNVVDYKYSITYINDSEVLSVKYVTDNSVAVSTANPAAQDLVEQWVMENISGGTVEFGGWMTAASVKLGEIPKDNTQNIVLYPYFTSPYTATFVDENSNILAWCFFNEIDINNLSTTFEIAEKNRPHPGDNFDLLYWQIRGTDLDDNVVNAQLDKDNPDWESFKGYKDVTITPKYKYLGADLIEVYDELTGELDHYEVAGYAGGEGSTLVEIPATVNGKEVTTINANAFSSYDDLTAVRIPDTITTINTQSFSADDGNDWNGIQRDTITLYYEGSPNDWKQAMDDLYVTKAYSYYTDYNKEGTYTEAAKLTLSSSWDYAMGDGSRVFFLGSDGKVDTTAGYWELVNIGRKQVGENWYDRADVYVWIYHEHEYLETHPDSCTRSYFDGSYTNYVEGTPLIDGEYRVDKAYWN